MFILTATFLLVLSFGKSVFSMPSNSTSNSSSNACPGPKTTFPRRAIVELVPADGANVRGTLKLLEYEDGLLIRGEVTGLEPGQHGFHVHEGGDVGGNCSAAGNHFSPNNVRPPPFQIRLNINNNRVTHGGPKSANKHAGDLGNLMTPKRGPTKVMVFHEKLTLDPKSKLSILNRSIVIHEKADDLGKGGTPDSHKTGNSGKRMACGLIKFRCPVEFRSNTGSG